MCILCKEWEKGKMTIQEGLDNIGELLQNNADAKERAHLFDLADRILDEEQEQLKKDLEE